MCFFCGDDVRRPPLMNFPGSLDWRRSQEALVFTPQPEMSWMYNAEPASFSCNKQIKWISFCFVLKNNKRCTCCTLYSIGLLLKQCYMHCTYFHHEWCHAVDMWSCTRSGLFLMLGNNQQLRASWWCFPSWGAWLSCSCWCCGWPGPGGPGGLGGLGGLVA